MSSFETTIGDITEIFDGPHATPEKTKCGPYYLSISSLNKGRLDLSQSAFLSEVDFVKWTKRVTPTNGDILFSYETRLGEAALMPDGIRACLGRRMGILRPKADKVTSEYLLYAYLSPKFQQTIISKKVRGATVDRIALNELPHFPIRIPSLQEQIKVAKLLTSLDSKIELNNRINAELEAMAKTLYDYWFVQFDFPFDFAQGKPDPNGKPYKTSGGKMVWNEELKREIPEGWKVTLVQNVLAHEYSKRKIPTSEIFSIGKIPVIDQSVDYIAGFTNEEDSIIEALEPRIVFGDHTRILKFINFDFARGADGTQVLLSNSKGIPQHLFYHSLLKIDLSNYGYARHFKFLKESLIILPEESVAQQFDKMIESSYKMIRENIFQNQQLSALRDWLLPMLMNGQVKVGDNAENKASYKIEEEMRMAAEPEIENKNNLRMS